MLELGNLMFGNSRGEFEVPRTDAWRGAWEALMKRAQRGFRGEPEIEGDSRVFENDTFVVRPYDWDAECDCGARDRMRAWIDTNPHDPNCYQTILRSLMTDGLPDRALLRNLCVTRGLTFPTGAMEHCDCGRNERSERIEADIGRHTDECRLIQPNFLFKPTSFRLSWYKRPFRDSYMSEQIDLRRWREILDVCALSLL